MCCSTLAYWCTTVYITAPVSDWLAILQQLFPTVVFRTGTPFCSEVSCCTSSLWLVEGLASWCTSLLLSFPTSSRVLVSVSARDLQPPPGWESACYLSSAVGSILQGSWKFLYHALEYSPPWTLPYHRTLRQPLNPAIRSPPGSRFTHPHPLGGDQEIIRPKNVLWFMMLPGLN